MSKKSNSNSPGRPASIVGILTKSALGIVHNGRHYEVRVNFLDLDDRLMLAVDGVVTAVSPSPARFKLDQGLKIETATAGYSFEYGHLYDGKTRYNLQPASWTIEARRRQLAQRFPLVSRSIAVISWIIVLAALLIESPQLAAWLLGLMGTSFVPPINLPGFADALLMGTALIAALERATRLDHLSLIDE